MFNTAPNLSLIHIYRQRHRLDAAIRHPAAQAVFPGAAGGLKGAAGVEQLDILSLIHI